ncbi:MAG: AsmA-like C-terminal domain-containing protein [Nitrospinota bacterium]
MSGKKPLIIILILSLLFIIGGIVFSVYYLLHLNYNDLITKGIEDIIQKEVSIENIDLSIRRGIGFKLDNVLIKEKGGDDKIYFLSADHLTVTIRLLPLIRKRFIVKEIILDTPYINIKRDKEGRFNLTNLTGIFIPPAKDVRGRYRDFHIVLNRFFIRNGRVRFTDKFISPESVTTELEDISFALERSLLKRVFLFTLNGRLPDRDEFASVSISGELKNIRRYLDPQTIFIEGNVRINSLNSSHFLDYYTPYIPLRPGGVLDIDANYSGNISGTFQSSGEIRGHSLTYGHKEAFLNPPAPHSAILKYDVRVDKDTIDLKELDIKIEGFTIAGKGLLKDRNSEDQKVAFEINTSPLTIERGKRYIPLKLLPPEIHDFIANRITNGEIKIGAVRFSGRISQLKRLDTAEGFDLLSGEISLFGITADLVEDLSPVRDIDMVIALKKGILEITHISGEYRGCKLTEVRGNISQIATSPMLDLTIRGDMDIKDVKDLFTYKIAIGGIKPYLNDIQSITGKATLNISLSGKVHDLSSLIIEGDIILNRLDLDHKKLPLPISALAGNIHISREILRIIKMSGYWGNSPLTLQGEIRSYNSENPFLDIRLNSRLNPSGFARLIRIEEIKDIELDGVADIELLAKGYLNRLKLFTSLNLTEANYQYKGWIVKGSGLKNQMSFKGTLIDMKEMQIDKLTLILGDSAVFAKGKAHLQKPQISIIISPHKIAMDDIGQIVSFIERDEKDGFITVALNANANAEDFRMEGDITLEQVGMQLTKLSRQISQLNAKINFTRDKIAISQATFKIGNSYIELNNGKIEDFYKPVVTINIHAPRLDFNDMRLKKQRSIREINQFLKDMPVFTRSSGKGIIIIDDGGFKDLRLGKIDADLLLKNGLIKAKDIIIRFGKSYLKGTAGLNLVSEKGFEFDINMYGKSMDIEELLKTLGPDFRNSMSGTISLSSNLWGSGYSLEEIRRSLFGKFHFYMKKGMINSSKLKAAMSSILNIPQQDNGRASETISQDKTYNIIRGDFLIKDGMAYTENFLMDTAEKRIFAVGNIDFGEKEINLLIGIAPLATLDRLINSIPIVGRILTGDDKGLLVTYYEVKGKMPKPKITPVPFKFLSEKIVDIIKGVLLTPREILTLP